MDLIATGPTFLAVVVVQADNPIKDIIASNSMRDKRLRKLTNLEILILHDAHFRKYYAKNTAYA